MKNIKKIVVYLLVMLTVFSVMPIQSVFAQSNLEKVAYAGKGANSTGTGVNISQTTNDITNSVNTNGMDYNVWNDTIKKGYLTLYDALYDKDYLNYGADHPKDSQEIWILKNTKEPDLNGGSMLIPYNCHISAGVKKVTVNLTNSTYNRSNPLIAIGGGSYAVDVVIGNPETEGYCLTFDVESFMGNNSNEGVGVFHIADNSKLLFGKGAVAQAMYLGDAATVLNNDGIFILDGGIVQLRVREDDSYLGMYHCNGLIHNKKGASMYFKSGEVRHAHSIGVATTTGIMNKGYLEMSGGSIHDCNGIEEHADGHGISNYEGEILITGGEITRCGGGCTDKGAAIDNKKGTLTVTGGKFYDNTTISGTAKAVFQGGTMYISGNPDFEDDIYLPTSDKFYGTGVITKIGEIKLPKDENNKDKLIHVTVQSPRDGLDILESKGGSDSSETGLVTKSDLSKLNVSSSTGSSLSVTYNESGSDKNREPKDVIELGNEPLKYSVSYDTNGGAAKNGDIPEKDDYLAEELITVTNTSVEKDNCIFAGWLNSYDNKVYKAGDTFVMPEQDVVLTAQWNPNYKATSLIIPTTINVFFGDETASSYYRGLSENERASFNVVLKDWLGTQNTLTIKPDSSGNGQGNCIKYIFTEKGTYSFTLTQTQGTEKGYVYDNSSFNVSVTVSSDVSFNLYVENITVSRNLGAGGDCEVKYNEDLGVWTFKDKAAIKFTNIFNVRTLKYDENLGTSTDTVTGMPSNITVAKGENVTVSTALPTRKGYKFTGWYEDRTGETKAQDTYELNSDKTLYARWEDIEYKVIYSWTGAPVTGVTLPSAQEGKHCGESITVDGTYKAGTEVQGTKDGKKGTYTFSGWSALGITITDGKFTMQDADVELTGSWKFTETEETTTSGDPETKETTTSGDPETKETTTSGDPKTEETTASGDPETKETTTSGDPKTEETTTSGDPKTEETTTSGDPKTEETSTSDDRETKETSTSGNSETHENNNSDTMKTGDTNNSTTWLILIIVAAMCIVTVSLVMRKNKKNNR